MKIRNKVQSRNGMVDGEPFEIPASAAPLFYTKVNETNGKTYLYAKTRDAANQLANEVSPIGLKFQWRQWSWEVVE